MIYFGSPYKLKSLLIGLFLMGGLVQVQAQNLNVLSFEDLPELQSQDQRPVFVFLTAEWCRYCKNVELTSFTEQRVIEKLNEQFYTVIFDIEDKRDIELFGLEFQYKSTGLNTGVHEFAELIGTVDGVLNTPTFVMFDENLRIQYQYGGYMNTEEIIALLNSALEI